MQRLLLIDANPWIYKGFYGGGDDPGLRADGLPTGAVAGFLGRLWDLMRKDLKDQIFSHGVAIFDAPGKNWRHKISDAYKANREAQPDDLILQLKLAKHVTPLMGIHAVEMRGYEADDLIATYARMNDEDGGETVIVSSDKDLMCLIRPGTAIFDPISKPGKSQWVGEAEVVARFGVKPRLVPDAQALSGDSVDNIPGVPKVGPMTAAKLLNQFGSLEMALENADIADVSPLIRQKLVDHAEDARLSRRLVALDDRVPVRRPLADLRGYPVRAPELLSALAALEITAFARWVAWAHNLRAEDAEPCPATLALAQDMIEWRAL